LGYGREGASVLTFLAKHPLCASAEVWILDRNPKCKLPRCFGRTPLKKHLGKEYLQGLERFSIIFRSPGIPLLIPELQAASKKGTIITSSTITFFEHCKSRIIGITGSKGKSTTATLIYEILRAAGFKTALAGNIGKPMLELLEQSSSLDFVVLELSSFQLQDLKRSPEIAVVLDIFPDHLDAHKDMDEYVEAKMSIAAFQKKFDTVFYFANNKLSKRIAQKSPGKKVFITPQNDTALKNIEMAASVAHFLRCSHDIINKTIKSFQGLPHRLERVRTLSSVLVSPPPDVKGKPKKHSCLLDFIDDSLATNPHAATLGLQSLEERYDFVVLLAGGHDTGLDYLPLASALKHFKKVRVILYGENREKIYKAISESGVEIFFADDLRRATQLGFSLAKKIIADLHHAVRRPHVAILLSPASKSFDQFKDAYDRGRAFKTLASRL